MRGVFPLRGTIAMRLCPCLTSLSRGLMVAISFLVAVAATSRNSLAEFAILAPAQDATLFENALGSLASGSGPAIFAGRINSSTESIRRSLLLFDVSSAIPAGSRITGVHLRLALNATSAGPAPVRLYRVSASWGEGASSSSGGGGAPATEGDATWIHRFYNEVPWENAGGDWDPLPRAEAIVDQPGPYSWGSTSEMEADVQSWLDNPVENSGWMLAGDETRPQTVKRFDSREGPDDSLHPSLEVVYSPPCHPNPAGPGFWRRQCEESIDSGILACADRILDDLALPEIRACDALLEEPPPSCEQRAATKLSVLVLNICAGMLQTTCPAVPAQDDACASTSVGERLLEISALLHEGDCRRAAACAALPD
jgi:hypothetical protein